MGALHHGWGRVRSSELWESFGRLETVSQASHLKKVTPQFDLP